VLIKPLAPAKNVISSGQFFDQVSIKGENQTYRLLNWASSDCSVLSKVISGNTTGFSTVTAYCTLGALRMASGFLSATLGCGNKAVGGMGARD
jgi:hypothetical protein